MSSKTKSTIVIATDAPMDTNAMFVERLTENDTVFLTDDFCAAETQRTEADALDFLDTLSGVRRFVVEGPRGQALDVGRPSLSVFRATTFSIMMRA